MNLNYDSKQISLVQCDGTSAEKFSENSMKQYEMHIV